MYALIATDRDGDIPAREDDQSYLNHSCLSSLSFGSLDMAWTAEHIDTARVMSRHVDDRGGRGHLIIDLECAEVVV